MMHEVFSLKQILMKNQTGKRTVKHTFRLTASEDKVFQSNLAASGLCKSAFLRKRSLFTGVKSEITPDRKLSPEITPISKFISGPDDLILRVNALAAFAMLGILLLGKRNR